MKFLNMINEQGGFTLNGNLEAKQDGYAVALQGHEQVLEAKQMTEQDVLNYMQAKSSLIEQNKNICFGAWLDEKTDKVYLDLSEVLPDKKQALKKAYKREQLAIFDLNTFDSIYL